ncbi:MAG: hypothetical protein DSY50_01860 [Desulfobulbus sp.]|nr:MAG: hypothetical protein DSY50_01860 [Desulfobulbus sp.]
MNCPKCKTVELRKRGYDSPANCYKCGGMWLGRKQLPQFIEHADSGINESGGTGHHDEITGLCPSGHGIMIRARIDIDQPFYLEKCPTCGGIWLDYGEWEKIVSNRLVEHLHEFWCQSWQAKQRKDKQRVNFLESNRQILGDQVFREVMNLSELLKEHPEKGRALALLQQEIF